LVRVLTFIWHREENYLVVLWLYLAVSCLNLNMYRIETAFNISIVSCLPWLRKQQMAARQNWYSMSAKWHLFSFNEKITSWYETLWLNLIFVFMFFSAYFCLCPCICFSMKKNVNSSQRVSFLFTNNQWNLYMSWSDSCYSLWFILYLYHPLFWMCCQFKHSHNLHYYSGLEIYATSELDCRLRLASPTKFNKTLLCNIFFFYLSSINVKPLAGM
jgi:hypothetical protein